MGKFDLKILSYVPNLIDYFRFALILTAGYLLTNTPADNQQSSFRWGLAVYCLSVLLDMVDGLAARHLCQKSAFGAWLDVVVDVTGRTLLWHKADVKFLSWLIPSLEFVTFSCVHAQFGALSWKQRFAHENVSPQSYTPSFVQKVFANGFYSVHGAFALGGVHCLPIIVVAAKSFQLVHPNSSLFVSFPTLFLLFICSSGRTYAACCEMWFILDHIRFLLSERIETQQILSSSTSQTSRHRLLNKFSQISPLPRSND